MKDAVILTRDESLFLIISASLGELGLSCGAPGEKFCRILIADADDRESLKAAASVRRKAFVLVSRRASEIRDHGADALLSRPVSTKELNETVATIIRKTETPKKPRAPRRDKITVDKKSRTVTVGAHSARLSENEFLVFSMLYEKRGEALSRDDIKKAVKGEDTNAADVYICYLRRKLESGGKRVIASVRGVGYKLL